MELFSDIGIIALNGNAFFFVWVFKAIIGLLLLFIHLLAAVRNNGIEDNMERPNIFKKMLSKVLCSETLSTF